MALPLFFVATPRVFLHENICPYYFMKLKHHFFHTFPGMKPQRSWSPLSHIESSRSSWIFGTWTSLVKLSGLSKSLTREIWRLNESWAKVVRIFLLPLWWIHVDTWKLSWWTEICPCRRFSVMFSCFDKKTRLIVASFFCLLSTRLLLPSCGFVRFLEFLKVVSFYKKKVKWMCCVSTGSRSVEAIDIYRSW